MHSDKDTTTGPNKVLKEFPPPKTDKPRPHICATCTRSFARLEHLKRHERSHTKEKPFECPECTRCFARRDLLLRHQQKLHMTTTPASRPRNSGRRESTSSVGNSGGRVRKNSISGTVGRPRANTLTHIDTSNLTSPPPTSSSDPSVQSKLSNTLPRLNTRRVQSMNLAAGSASLMALDLDFEGVLFGSASTINPAALHFNPNHTTYDTATSPFDAVFPNISGPLGVQDEDTYEWMNMLGNDNFGNEDAFESSSPSALSTTSIGGYGDFQESTAWWNQATEVTNNDYVSPQFTTSPPPPPGTISPKDLQAQHHYQEQYYPSLLGQGYPTESMMYNLGEPYSPAIQPDIDLQPASHANTTTKTAINSITDSMRLELLNALSQPMHSFAMSSQGLHLRRHSTVQSPSSNATKQFNANLPSTTDLQRFVEAYIRFYHPHLPFLHVPTLNFASPVYSTNYKQEDQYMTNRYASGGGCLLLSVACIGALYEAEYTIAKELFEASAKLIHTFLDGYRKASISAAAAAVSGFPHDAQSNTPLWLVQSMLLNVIFGLNSGENMVSELTLSHCSAVVSLARSAGLCKQPNMERKNRDTAMMDSEMNGLNSLSLTDAWGVPIKVAIEDANNDWLTWIVDEERKRTLYAVHKLSSMLCVAYNHAPVLTNSEIRLHLPCEEELWAADTSAIWNVRGGAEAAAKSAILFSTALNTLLSAGEPQEMRHRQPGNPGFDDNYGSSMQTHFSPSQLKPSHFGALSLILALHVYIWETRRLSHARQWSSSEVEAIHAHIEPALRAWEEAWASNPQSNIERLNPFGSGPMSTDSIPLLDLAYIRLFVDLGRSRTALFNRDYQSMVDGLNRNWNDQASGSSSSPSTNSELTDTPQSAMSPASSPTSTVDSPNLLPLKAPLMSGSMHQHLGALSSRHEKHLRRAAFYAADALAISEKSGVSVGAFGVKELPMQSLICALDSAQVLAEWISIVQERIRPFMGTLGDASCNLTSIEGLMILENEDRVLLNRVFEVVGNAEAKLAMEWGEIFHKSKQFSLSAKVLRVSAYMLEKVAVWPSKLLFL